MAYGYNQFGVTFGGFADFYVIETVTFSPFVIFEQLGSTNGVGDIILRTNHFSFPLMLRFDPVFSGNPFLDKFSLEGALVPGVLLLAKDNSGPLGNELTRYDLRAMYGISYKEKRVGFFFRLGSSLSKFVQSDPFIFRNRTRAHIYISLGAELYFYKR